MVMLLIIFYFAATFKLFLCKKSGPVPALSFYADEIPDGEMHRVLFQGFGLWNPGNETTTMEV